MKIHRNNGLSLFVHIPKCGGTSIENMIARSFLNSELPEHSTADLSLLLGQENGRQLQHLCLNEFSEFIDFGDVDSVSCLIRNPADRIISELNWVLSSTCFQPEFSFEAFFSQFERSEDFKMKPGFSRHYLMQGSFLSSVLQTKKSIEKSCSKT